MNKPKNLGKQNEHEIVNNIASRLSPPISCFGNIYRNWFNMRRAIYAVLLTYAVSICFCSVAYLTFAVRERAEIVDEESGYAFIGTELPDEQNPNLMDERALAVANLSDGKAFNNLFDLGLVAKNVKFRAGPELDNFLKHKKSKQPSDKDGHLRDVNSANGLAGDKTNRSGAVGAGSDVNGTRQAGENPDSGSSKLDENRRDWVDVEYKLDDGRPDDYPYSDKLEANSRSDDAAARSANETKSLQLDEKMYRRLRLNSSHLNISTQSQEELLKILREGNENLFEPRKAKTYVVSVWFFQKNRVLLLFVR